MNKKQMKKMTRFLYNKKGTAHNYNGQYFKGSKKEEGVYSIDKITLFGMIDNEIFNSIIEDYNKKFVLSDDVEIKNKEQFGFGYRHSFTYKTYEIIGEVGERFSRQEMGTAFIMFLNNLKDCGRTCSEFRIEFNPNKIKYNHSVFIMISMLCRNCKELKILSADFAFDVFGLKASDLIAESFSKSELSSNSSLNNGVEGTTWYIGKINSLNRIKIYQKDAEIVAKNEGRFFGVDYIEYNSPVCRIEETVPFKDFNVLKFKDVNPFEDEFFEYMKKIKLGKVLESGRNYSFKNISTIDGLEIDVSERCEIYCILNGVVKLDDFPRRKKERLKKTLEKLEIKKEVHFKYTPFLDCLYDFVCSLFDVSLSVSEAVSKSIENTFSVLRSFEEQQLIKND